MKKHCEMCDFETTHGKNGCVVCEGLVREAWLRAAKLVKGSDGPVMNDELTKLIERNFKERFGGGGR